MSPTDGRPDRRTDRVISVYPLHLRWVGYNDIIYQYLSTILLYCREVILFEKPRRLCVAFFVEGYVLHAEHVSCVNTNCAQHQWVTPSLFNSSLCLFGGKHHQNIILRLVLQNVAFPGCFPYVLCHPYYFPLLSTGWVVIVACGVILVQGWWSFCRNIVNWWTVAISNGKSTKWEPYFFFIFLIVNSNL